MDEELNYVKTGGEFGRKRRLPGYIISKKGKVYQAHNEKTGKLYAEYFSLEQLDRDHAALDNARLKEEEKRNKIRWT